MSGRRRLEQLIKRTANGYLHAPGAFWLWGIMLLTALALALVIDDRQSPLRVVVLLGFMLAAPGLALARALGIQGLAGTLVFAIATSIAANIILAGSLLYAGIWEPELVFFGLAALTLVLVALAALRGPPSEPQGAQH